MTLSCIPSSEVFSWFITFMSEPPGSDLSIERLGGSGTSKTLLFNAALTGLAIVYLCVASSSLSDTV